jgi:hypothetical protein
MKNVALIIPNIYWQPTMNSPHPSAARQTRSELELAQQLASQLAIKPNDWHRLNRNRKIRAQEQAAAALVYLLKDQPEEALSRLQQAVGWLDHSLTAPPCPSHGEKRPSAN